MIRQIGWSLVAIAVTTAGPGLAQPAGSRSAPLAQHLAAALAERHLEAIAAADPSAPDRFVGALIFPGVQLLVVAGQYAAPDAIRSQIAAREYKDVYLALAGASVPASRLFIQDLKADGLHPSAAAGVDVIYEHVDKQTVFDGKPARTAFDKADAEYSRLLSLLLNEVTSAAVSGTRGAK